MDAHTTVAAVAGGLLALFLALPLICACIACLVRATRGYDKEDV